MVQNAECRVWGRVRVRFRMLGAGCGVECRVRFRMLSSHNVVNRAIGIMEAFSNVNIVAKLLVKLQEVESSCRCTYNGFGGVIM